MRKQPGGAFGAAAVASPPHPAPMAAAAPSGTASIHLGLSDSLGMLAWRAELSAAGRVRGLSDEMALQAVVSRRRGVWRLSDMDRLI